MSDQGFRVNKHTKIYNQEIEAYINNDNHYFLVLKHTLEKDYGVCPECGEKRNISKHKHST